MFCEDKIKYEYLATLSDHFEVNFQDTFLDQSIWIIMQMSELMMSSPHSFSFILYTEKEKEKKEGKKKIYIYFSYENVRLALIPLWIDAE